jgi:hypothetical protein
MDDKESEPGEPGRDDPVPRHRARSPKNKERRQAGPRAALVETPLDESDSTRNRGREQSYPVRWLRTHYAVSGAFAAVIAGEFGWGGV